MEKGLRSRPFFTLPCPPVQPACILYNVSVIFPFLLHKVDQQRFVEIIYLSYSPIGYCNTNLIQTCVRTLTLNSGHSFFLCAGGFNIRVSFAYLLQVLVLLKIQEKTPTSTPTVHLHQACPEFSGASGHIDSQGRCRSCPSGRAEDRQELRNVEDAHSVIKKVR